MYRFSIDMADRKAPDLRRSLDLAERLSDSAISAGSSLLKTLGLKVERIGMGRHFGRPFPRLVGLRHGAAPGLNSAPSADQRELPLRSSDPKPPCRLSAKQRCFCADPPSAPKSRVRGQGRVGVPQDSQK